MWCGDVNLQVRAEIKRVHGPCRGNAEEAETLGCIAEDTKEKQADLSQSKLICLTEHYKVSGSKRTRNHESGKKYWVGDENAD